MKFIGKVFLSYLVVLGQVMPYLSFAAPSDSAKETAKLLMSPVDMFSSEFNKNGIYLESPTGARVVNEYRLLGFSNIPDITHDGFKEALRTQNLVLSQSPEALGKSSEYYRLLDTAKGRATLFRQYRSAFSSLSVITGENLTLKTENLVRDLRVQVIEQGFYNSESDPKIKSEKIQLEVNRRLLNSFPEYQREEAKERVVKAQRTLARPESRARFNYSNGLSAGGAPDWKSNFSLKNQYRNFKGERLVRVQDPFGKDIDVSIPKTADGIEKVRGSDLMQDLKKGSVQTGLMGLAFMVIIFGSSELAMITDYENNPLRFEETLNQTMSWAMPASIASFFVAGNYTGKGVEYLDISRKSKANLNALAQSKTMFANNPQLRREFIKANMATLKSSTFLSRATSYSGMTGGFLGSQLIFGLVDRYVDKLASCRALLGSDKALENGRHTKFERDRLKQACDKTFADISMDLISSPQTWMQLTALLSTKTIMTFGMNRLQMMKYAFSSNAEAQAALRNSPIKGFKYKVLIKSRGLLAAPVVGTVVGFVVFSLIFWAVGKGLEWGVSRLTLNVPATQAAENIRELFATYQAQGWDMEKLCDDRNLLQGGLLDYFKPLLFWQDTNKCGTDLVNAFIENHQKVNGAWRDSLANPVLTAIQKWQEYTFKATNLQRSAYLFYKDVAEQIKVQRNSGKKVQFNRVYNDMTWAKETLGYANTHLYNHPLPLFRSEPYFGWNYKLAEDTNTHIPYPIWDGQTTNWAERFENRIGVEELTQRKDKFKSDVLPRVIAKLNEREATITFEDEKKDIRLILKYLGYKNRRGMSDLGMIAKGLHLISTRLETPGTAFSCESAVKCFWVDLHTEFFDSSIWAEDKNKVPTYRDGHNYFAGYQTASLTPYGVKPIGPGQGFFIRYSDRLANNGLDPYYFVDGYQSMTDYLLKQMVCGVDVKNGESMMVNWFTYQMGWSSPEFKAPRISLKGKMNPCYSDSSNNRWRRTAPPGSPSFYNYIEDKTNPEMSYGGIVEFLYNEADEDFVQNFDQWWATHVDPQFSAVIETLYKDYYKAELIDVKLNDVITKDNIDNNCYEKCVDFNFSHKKGIAAALKQELDTYFTYLFEPLLKDSSILISTDWSEIKDEKLARAQLVSEFNNVRSEIYDIFAFVSGRSQSLVHEELLNDYQDLLVQASADAQAAEPETSQSHEILKLRALKLLLKQKIYQLKILTRTEEDGESSDLGRIYQSALEYLNEISFDSELEKQMMRLNIDQNYLTLKADYDSYSNRNQHVVLDFKDWPEDIQKASPMQSVLRSSQDQIHVLFDQLFSLQENRQLFFGVPN
jgi:hypothetical protein